MRYLVTGGSGFIGTNWIDHLTGKACDVLNVDTAPPMLESQKNLWRRCDILEVDKLSGIFRDFMPEVVIHLAARTDCDEKTTVNEGYRTNTDGVKNLMSAVRACGSVMRLLVVSSQYVCRPGYNPAGDTDWKPHTVYGESKVETEKLTREACFSGVWTIVRPTNIWGPWHLRYRREFWRILQKGLYFHPAGAPVVRSYGYVENVIWQCMQLLNAGQESVNGQVFYVGDPADDIFRWTDCFSRHLTGKGVRKMPRSALRLIALLGDAVSAAGFRFPLTSSRFRSMTSDYAVSLEKTENLTGKAPYSLDEGVEKTVAWLNAYQDADLDAVRGSAGGS